MNKGQSTVYILSRAYSRLLLIAFALIPSAAACYLYLFQRPPLRYENFRLHEIAITIAILVGVFISYVTWKCYRSSGEPFLRWLTLGFLGFTFVYAPHGIFTGYSHHNLWLFLLYGSVSRLIMGGCLLAALLVYGKPVEAETQRIRKLYWLGFIGIFLLVDLLVAGVASSPVAGSLFLRATIEIGASCLCLSGIVILIARNIRSPLMTVFYGLSLACFAQSSLAFVLGRIWNHLWWLAHGIFATGFLLLSYGVIRAFLTTRSFATVYSQEELMERAVAANAEAQQALGRLKGAHNALAQKADELSHANLLLDQAKRELEQRNAELDAFSSSIAHQLRSPIFAVDGFVQILMDDFGVQAPPTARKHLTAIRQFTRAMDLMIKDLLFLAQSQSEKLRLQPTPLNAVVESVLRDIKAEFPHREVDFRIDALPVANCDPGLIRQVFTNLLSNAVKFTRDQKLPVVKIAHQTTEIEFIISVHDNGVGFDPRLMDKLFKPFTRLPSARGYEGNGVGLATAQRIVLKHGGRIWADAQLNQGATFYFALQKTPSGCENVEYAMAAQERDDS